MLATAVLSTAFSLRGPAPFAARRVTLANVAGPMMSSAYDFNARDLKSNEVVELSQFKGK